MPSKHDKVSASFDWAGLRLGVGGWAIAEGECETEGDFLKILDQGSHHFIRKLQTIPTNFKFFYTEAIKLKTI
jgi:hypothetical protein